MSKVPQQPRRIENKKARFHFEILEEHEAGIELTGSEVKSLRNGQGKIEESFAMIRGGQAFLRDCHIAPYVNATVRPHEPTRERRLLLHRREIRKLHEKVTQQGLTLIPLSLFFNERGLVKVNLALARGKKLFDKRETIRKREHQRDMARAIRRRRSS